MMKPKAILFNDEIRAKLLTGAEKVFDVVSGTMGARGQNVLFTRPFGVSSTKDGVSVAIQVKLEDKFEEMGAFLMKEAMAKTTKTSGDGTTATCVLLYAIIQEALKHYIAGVNPVLLKKGIELAINLVIRYIREKSKEQNVSKQDYQDIANIAINGDTEIAKIIADAMDKVGADGVITARESNSPDTYLEMIEGMQFEQGAIFGGFLNPATQELVLDNPMIICFDGMIRTIPQIQPIVQVLGKEGKAFLILCDNMNQDVAEFLIHNHLKNVITCCVVRTPGTGRLNEENLKDLSVYTGAKLFSESGGGADLAGAKFVDFGTADKVKIKRNNTMILNGGGEKADIEERVQTIRKQIEELDDDKQKELYYRRIARMTSSVGVINVGGQTVVELQERKDRVDDAIQAVKAAKSDGIVSGGGITYLHAIKALKGVIKSTQGDDKYGIEIVAKALTYPLRAIVSNAGINADVILNELYKKDDINIGYDVSKEKFVNLREKGIIDPALVLITALKNACSHAILMLTTRAGIVDKEEK